MIKSFCENLEQQIKTGYLRVKSFWTFNLNSKHIHLMNIWLKQNKRVKILKRYLKFSFNIGTLDNARINSFAIHIENILAKRHR